MWIESHQSLARHRKTMRVVAILKCDRHKVIGHLHELWWWALDNVPVTGDMGDATLQDVGIAAGWSERTAETFGAAILEAKFIERGPDGQLMLHEWWGYAGKLMEQRDRQRADNAERQRKARDRHALRNASVTRDVTAMSQPETRESRNNHGATVPDLTKPNQTKEKTGSKSAEAPFGAATPTPEELPFTELFEPSEQWLRTLMEIPHYPRDAHKDGLLLKWVAGKKYPDDLLEAKATAMRAAVTYDGAKKCWLYNRQPRADLRAMFQDWVGRAGSNGNGLSSGHSNGVSQASASGRPGTAGAINHSVPAGSKYRSAGSPPVP